MLPANKYNPYEIGSIEYRVYNEGFTDGSNYIETHPTKDMINKIISLFKKFYLEEVNYIDCIINHWRDN